MFVFKLLSNFALKIILEIILELNEDFDVTIQKSRKNLALVIKAKL